MGPAPTPRPASFGPVVARLLQQAVPSSQAWRDSLSDHQFKAAQPLPRGSVIHNGNSVLYHSSTQASGMDHRDRLEGRLPSHLGPSQHQEILSVRDIGERPINSECLHLGYQWHQKFTKPLAPVVQLLRTRGIRVHAYLDDWIIRADSPELCSAHAQETTYMYMTSSTIFGVDDKLEEIPSRTLTYTRISRPSFQPQTGPYISTQVVSRDSHQHHVLSVYIKDHVCSQNHSIISHFAPFFHQWRLQLVFPVLDKTTLIPTCSTMGQSNPTEPRI